MKLFKVLIIVFTLASACMALQSARVGDVAVSVLCDGNWLDMKNMSHPGKTFMDWTFKNVYDMQIITGREYALRVENTSPYHIGVYVYVDGINTIGREKSKGTWWFLSPYQSFDLAGWQIDDEYRSNFKFVELGSPSGQGGGYPGWIFVAQYRVDMPEPVTYREQSNHNRPAADSKDVYEAQAEVEAAPAPSVTTMSKAKGESFSRGGAETGAGSVEDHHVTHVNYELKRMPQGLLAIKYGVGDKPKPIAQKPCDKYLGIEGQGNVNDGIFVSKVIPNSPAAQAKIKKGDVIRFFEGKRVRTIDELRAYIAKTNAGQRVTLEIVSMYDGRIYDVTAYIGCR